MRSTYEGRARKGEGKRGKKTGPKKMLHFRLCCPFRHARAAMAQKVGEVKEEGEKKRGTLRPPARFAIPLAELLACANTYKNGGEKKEGKEEPARVRNPETLFPRTPKKYEKQERGGERRTPFARGLCGLSARNYGLCLIAGRKKAVTLMFSPNVNFSSGLGRDVPGGKTKERRGKG